MNVISQLPITVIQHFNKALLTTLVASIFLSSLAQANEIKQVGVVDGSQKNTVLSIVFKDALSAKPKITSLLNPLSITIDFDGVINTSGKNTLSPKLANPEVKNVRVITQGNRTRMIVYLNKQVTYQEARNGNEYRLNLAPATARKSKLENIVNGVDFRRLPNQGGSILLKVTGGGVLINPRTEGKQILVDINNTNPVNTIVKHYDVSDFGTLIQSFDLYPLNNQQLTRVSILTSSGDFNYTAYQSNEYIIIEVKPLTPVEALSKKQREKAYQGERISLNFNDIDVRTALKIVAEVSKLDLIISDSVSGQITLNLKEIPWDEALDVILRTKNLAKRINGKILRIGTRAEFASQDKAELDSNTVALQLSPLRTEFIQINYAKASDIASLVKGDQKSSFVTERGSLTVDARTNTLLVRETSDNLAEIRSFISRLDIPVRQVLIEGRIVIANDSFSDEIGSRFGIAGIETSGSNTIAIGPNVSESQNLLSSFTEQTGAAVGTFPSGSIAGAGVNFSNPAGGGSLALSLFNPRSGLLSLELSAMQVEDRGEVVSNPRIITVEQKEASIEQGVDIPYQETGANGATTTSFRKATLGLTVTPQITPDDKVIMDLEVKNDTVGSAGANGVPSIDTRTVTTQVIVANGDTVVLGGVFEQTKRRSKSKVPLFGDIPILGALFRRDSQSNVKSELLIFVTPKIIKTKAR